MAQSNILATCIWTLGHYTFNDPQNVISINAADVAAFSPVNGWLVRNMVPGNNQVQYNLTFDPTSADLADVNTIAGVYIEQDGKGALIDAISISNVILVLNGTGTIQRRYGAAPSFTTPTPLWYCVTRSDDGSGSAHDDVVTDYVSQYIGNVRLKTNTSGVSVYTFQAFGLPKAIGSDTVAQC